jgi:hypothetical protein
VGAAELEVLAVLARTFGFVVREHEVIDRFRRLVHSRNRPKR